MAIDLSTVVVVLGTPGTTVLDVDTAGNILDHLTRHVAEHVNDQGGVASSDLIHGTRHAPTHTHQNLKPGNGDKASPDSLDRVLRFFGADGERLRLELLADWWTFTLEPTGDYIDVEQLEADVHAVFEVDRPDMVTSAANASVPLPELPPPGSWTDQLDALRVLFSDESPDDRRNWAHNFFVHGWIS